MYTIEYIDNERVVVCKECGAKLVIYKELPFDSDLGLWVTFYRHMADFTSPCQYQRVVYRLETVYNN